MAFFSSILVFQQQKQQILKYADDLTLNALVQLKHPGTKISNKFENKGTQILLSHKNNRYRIVLKFSEHVWTEVRFLKIKFELEGCNSMVHICGKTACFCLLSSILQMHSVPTLVPCFSFSIFFLAILVSGPTFFTGENKVLCFNYRNLRIEELTLLPVEINSCILSTRLVSLLCCCWIRRVLTVKAPRNRSKQDSSLDFGCSASSASTKIALSEQNSCFVAAAAFL